MRSLQDRHSPWLIMSHMLDRRDLYPAAVLASRAGSWPMRLLSMLLLLSTLATPPVPLLWPMLPPLLLLPPAAVPALLLLLLLPAVLLLLLLLWAPVLLTCPSSARNLS